ncbi:MAG TPA: nucleoside triphosphatase YtkD [Pseudoneobacillus sp.]|nr:nucleoside triphosphatase YtkD [Pseudoneobacillus sp.]
MNEFIDCNGYKVQFFDETEEINDAIKHVLIICKFKEKWLLTNHKSRGWEFPGGKVEKGETLEEAANREVWEETGAILKNLTTIGTYKVYDAKGTFSKKVFFGVVDHIESTGNYLETNGPVLIDEHQLQQERFQRNYSFIMKDQVLDICLAKLNTKKGVY